MKLENFLKESNTNLDIDQVSKFRDEVAESLDKFSALINKAGFNIVEYITEPDHETEFGVVFSNKILDISVSIDIVAGNRGTNSESFNVYIDMSINDGYAVGGGQTLATTISSYSFSLLNNEESLIQKIDLVGPQLQKLASGITDWYFDVSSEFGHIKLFVEKRGAENLVRALAGDFTISKNSGEIFK